MFATVGALPLGAAGADAEAIVATTMVAKVSLGIVGPLGSDLLASAACSAAACELSF